MHSFVGGARARPAAGDPSDRGRGGAVAGAVRSAVVVTANEPEPRSFGKQVVLGGLLVLAAGILIGGA